MAAGRRGTRVLGLLVGNVVLGFSYGGFSRHHDAHHVYPNMSIAIPTSLAARSS